MLENTLYFENILFDYLFIYSTLFELDDMNKCNMTEHDIIEDGIIFYLKTWIQTSFSLTNLKYSGGMLAH